MATPEFCPFCRPAAEQIVRRGQQAIIVMDRYPVALGHALVVPLRHVASIFDLDEGDYREIWELVAWYRRHGLEAPVDGWTVGVNDGATAGQTVAHAHVHVIPRRKRDVPDPRGGVRWVIPDKADYWSGS